GYNRFQIAALLQQNGVADKDAFLEATLDASPIHDLAPGAQSVEGFLFPATYKFPRHAKPGEIVREMTDHFRVEWQSLSMDNPPPDLHTPREIVTLASLVESETPKTSERPVIAGVFLNRLRIGLPLQCDPTVIYALEEQGAYTGSLSLADLRTDSPYNTYRHAGLPPGPIANPGEASLRAALHPDSVDYLYFVADTEGGHFFSRTLAEHNRNVARYRHLMGREDPKPIAPPRPARKKMGHKKKE
ncbi:MAG: endolytic transglycosylase MltG, partial [Bryobacteraceae bacterium]